MDKEGVVFLIPKEYANNKEFMASIRRFIEGHILMYEANRKVNSRSPMFTRVLDKGGRY